MKIYFAGSITGGRGDQGLYLQIVELLKKHGTVLTEHVASLDLGHLGQAEADAAIYERDVAWIAEADALVAEVTTVSLGVGYEIGLAESLDKPILCLHRTIDNRRTSPMILGNRRVQTKQYREIEELPDVLDSFFSEIGSTSPTKQLQEVQNQVA